MSSPKQLLACLFVFALLGTVFTQEDVCRSLSAWCWFDSSCCSGLCQGFRCRISEQLFSEIDSIGKSPNNLNTAPRRRITI